MKTKSKNSDKLGYVYFILNPKTNAIKIGFSMNPERRIKQLNTSCDAELVLLYTVRGTYDTEKYYHRMFRNDRLKGEFFKSDRILEFIRLDRLTKDIMRQEGII